MITPQKALDRAKIKLMTERNSVFISTVLFSLKTVFVTNHPQVDTAGTNGIDLLIDEDYFIGLTEPERVGLLYHETWHVAWNHMARGKDLQHERYNHAGDYVINLLATDAGYTLPPGALLDTKYKGMATKQVYDLLPENTGKGGKKPSKGIGSDIIFDTKDTPAEKEMQLTNVLIKAMTQSKLANEDPGAIPGELKIMLEDLINPKLPWQILLQNYMTNFAKDDYTWKRPNRRFLPDFYLPSTYSDAVGHIAIAVDTSGSVTNNEFKAFISEVQGIKEMLNPELFTIIDFDTSIKEVKEVHADESIADLSFSGRGGTNISPVWKWAKKNNPLVMIIFSDMEFSYPSDKTECPVLWIAVNNDGVEMPFGDTIHFTTD